MKLLTLRTEVSMVSMVSFASTLRPFICCVRVLSVACFVPVVTLTLYPLCEPLCVLCPFCPQFVRCVHVVSVISSASVVVSLLCLGRGEPKEDATKLKTVLFIVGGNGRNHHHARNTSTIDLENRCETLPPNTAPTLMKSVCFVWVWWWPDIIPKLWKSCCCL